jgi:hypothetical protein
MSISLFWTGPCSKLSKILVVGSLNQHPLFVNNDYGHAFYIYKKYFSFYKKKTIGQSIRLIKGEIIEFIP